MLNVLDNSVSIPSYTKHSIITAIVNYSIFLNDRVTLVGQSYQSLTLSLSINSCRLFSKWLQTNFCANGHSATQQNSDSNSTEALD